MIGKFQRNFIITVSDLLTGDVLTLRPPFTINFSVNRAFFGSPNASTIKIYGLNESSRSFLRKDWSAFDYYKGITFAAGYGNNLAVLTKGNITLGTSYRQGTEYITEISILDGGASFLNSNFSGEFSRNSSSGTIIRTIMKSLEEQNVSMGSVSPQYSNIIGRGNAYSGNATDLLTEITGGGFFIDNNVANCIMDNEYILGESLIINSQTGLLGLPKKERQNVTFDMLLEPRVFIGQKIKIDVKSKQFDGDYIVRGITHNGTISDTIGERATTSITCTKAIEMRGLMPNV